MLARDMMGVSKPVCIPFQLALHIESCWRLLGKMHLPVPSLALEVNCLMGFTLKVLPSALSVERFFLSAIRVLQNCPYSKRVVKSRSLLSNPWESRRDGKCCGVVQLTITAVSVDQEVGQRWNAGTKTELLAQWRSLLTLGRT